MRRRVVLRIRLPLVDSDAAARRIRIRRPAPNLPPASSEDRAGVGASRSDHPTSARISDGALAMAAL
jgi:hypothetical protein